MQELKGQSIGGGSWMMKKTEIIRVKYCLDLQQYVIRACNSINIKAGE